MPKVIYTESQGLYQAAGTGIQFTTDELSLTALPTTPVQAITAASAVTSPGVYTVSGSAIVEVTMPDPSSVPGGVFVFRAASAHAHDLTGSAAVAGVNIFAGMAGATPANNGQNLALENVVGSSVSLISDGLSFCVLAASGTVVIS